MNAPRAAAVLGRLGTAKTTAGPIDVQVAGPAAAVLLTPPDRAPLASSRSMLLSIPGYSLRSLPALGNRQPNAASVQPQNLVNYRGTIDWWTLDPTNSPNPTKPSGEMNSGWQPTYIERVEAWITLHTHATNITVSALDGAGNVFADLPSSEVQAVAGGFVIHVNGAGQVQSAWFTIRTAAPRGAGHRFLW
ncbi:MAG: hypothetical protein LAQ69_29485 [Acidobacteriia bacterium]|nr:hypothetical protein [Terriglobia bacterium]